MKLFYSSSETFARKRYQNVSENIFAYFHKVLIKSFLRFMKIFFCIFAIHMMESVSVEIILNCDYNVDSKLWSGWGNLDVTGFYYCNAFNLSVTEENSTVIGAIGNHLSDKTNDNVELLNIHSQNIHVMPKGLGKIFPNLRGLLIQVTKLKEVKNSDLTVFPKLKWIYLSRNQFESLEFDLFLNTDLEHISFYGNPLKHIGPNILDGLNNLKEVHFGSANCISMAVKDPLQMNEMREALYKSCPPTFKMMKKAIIESVDFKRIIDIQVYNKINQLAKKVFELGEEVDDNSKRIESLEENITLMMVQKLLSKLPFAKSFYCTSTKDNERH